MATGVIVQSKDGMPHVELNGASTIPAAITIPHDFEIQKADDKLEQKHQIVTSSPSVPLGVLRNFTGHFAGTGFNLIFRPNSGQTTFTNAVVPPPPTPPSENVLELNLTTETLTFSKALGSVPNRGLEAQTDIFLNGVPYVQVINDVTNLATGKADAKPSGIHFEPGLWMHVPATTTDPVLGESLVRMASIPHGTTINAECPALPITIAGPPDFLHHPVNITPFPINTDQAKNGIRFHSQDALNVNTPRLPQDLTKFIAAGTINQAILDNPNVVLHNANKGKTITKTEVFTVTTIPKSPELGSGTTNIAFLLGASAGPQVGPNAQAAQMTATFWIETVQHEIVVPVYKLGQPPLKIRPNPAHPGAAMPVFIANPPHEITSPVIITVTSTQIQYSQTVFLNFARLTWPHVSVATLVPTTEQMVPPEAWKTAKATYPAHDELK